MLAKQHNLDNIKLIVDANNSSRRSLEMNKFREKFLSFGWDTVTINGHDHIEIRNSLNLVHSNPIAVIANTIKGHGCKMMVDDPNEWHHKIPTEEEYKQLLNE